MIICRHGWAVADERIMDSRMRRAPEHADGETGTRLRTRRRAGRADPQDATRDAGFSIVEIVATIAVMSIIMAPLFSGVIASIRASTYTRNTAQVITTIENAADRVNRSTKRCDYTSVVQNAVKSLGWLPSQVTVVQSRYTPGATPALATPGTWSTDGKACLNNVLTPLLVQRVTIKVSSPDGNVSRTIEVIKSDI